MAMVLEISIAARTPKVSETIPHRIRPNPLHRDRTPTNIVANDALAPDTMAKSRAKLMIELPLAEVRTEKTKNLQKLERRTISLVVMSAPEKRSWA